MATSSMGIDGLVSGLNTTDLINQLMSVESGPQTLLKTKQSDTQTFIAALQALNTKVSSLGTAATTASTATSWAALTATSSATSVTATATTSASPTQVSFTVDKLAQRQVSLTDVFTDVASFTGSGNSLTLTSAAGSTQIDTTGITSVTGLASAITNSNAGVSAVAVQVTGGYRLQLSAKQTGAANAFQLYQGTPADVTAGTATAKTLTSLTAAQDAQLTLWPGTSAAQTFTSTTNTFSNVLTGVSITTSAVETNPVTLTLGRDTTALSTLGSNLVSQLNLVLGEISSRTSSTTTTDPTTGGTVVTPGVLGMDSSVSTLQQQLTAAASYPVNGVSPSTVGISIQRDGTFAFDQAAYSAALAADPQKVQDVVSGLAARVAAVTTSTSDPTSGSLTAEITAQQGVVKDLGDQISQWDVTLQLRRESLQTTYSNLEVTLSNLKSQSSWLSSQLGSLSGSSSSSSN
ncbi:flagellar filament capping protein FliD [Cellulomonas sp. 73-145]|uniref:flagellar filament capping protein FliD n=1 Tax=Cellulomonas sp. 73-145 TaxID=1895739 RepID=UPI0025BF4C3C|nr:flagellar filament capping protein FliD [Cellulomonas sp. 73-145]